MCLSATSMRKDLQSTEYVDDIMVKDIIDGYNVNDDGTVTNHGLVHIDYIVSPIESFAENYIIFKFHDQPVPECCTFNCDELYSSLVNIDIGTYDWRKTFHHFYERDIFGNPTSKTNMPGENDWGSKRQANYYLADTFSSMTKCDAICSNRYKASEWARRRLVTIYASINREETNDMLGRIYRNGEERFASGELYAEACLAQAYSLREMSQ